MVEPEPVFLSNYPTILLSYNPLILINHETFHTKGFLAIHGRFIGI